jgi:hypothetical protein
MESIQERKRNVRTYWEADEEWQKKTIEEARGMYERITGLWKSGKNRRF